MVSDTEDGSVQFLHSKEGVTQGYPLVTIKYGIEVLPLIRELGEAHPCITQPWYADDAGAGGGNPGVSWHTYRNCRQGGHRGATSRNQPIVKIYDHNKRIQLSFPSALVSQGLAL